MRQQHSIRIALTASFLSGWSTRVFVRRRLFDHPKSHHGLRTLKTLELAQRAKHAYPVGHLSGDVRRIQYPAFLMTGADRTALCRFGLRSVASWTRLNRDTVTSSDSITLMKCVPGKSVMCSDSGESRISQLHGEALASLRGRMISDVE